MEAPHGSGTGLGYYQPGYRASRQGCLQDLFLGLLSLHAWSLAWLLARLKGPGKRAVIRVGLVRTRYAPRPGRAGVTALLDHT